MHMPAHAHSSFRIPAWRPHCASLSTQIRNCLWLNQFICNTLAHNSMQSRRNCKRWENLICSESILNCTGDQLFYPLRYLCLMLLVIYSLLRTKRTCWARPAYRLDAFCYALVAHECTIDHKWRLASVWIVSVWKILRIECVEICRRFVSTKSDIYIRVAMHWFIHQIRIELWQWKGHRFSDAVSWIIWNFRVEAWAKLSLGSPAPI